MTIYIRTRTITPNDVFRTTDPPPFAGARSILDLGCGTARHAVEFAQRGYSVDGVDLSPQMVRLAQTRLQGLPAEIQKRLKIVEGDVSQYVSAANMLSLRRCFTSRVIRRRSCPEGTIWVRTKCSRPRRRVHIRLLYGPAVLSDRPVTRVNGRTRRACALHGLPSRCLHADRNIVEVTYTLTVVDGRTGHADETMRFMRSATSSFLSLELLADNAGLELVETGQWLGGSTNLSPG